MQACPDTDSNDGTQNYRTPYSHCKYPGWVIRVVLTARRSLPVFLSKRTISEVAGMSQRCQQPTRPTIGFFLRDPAAVRLAPRFVNVKSCTAEVGELPHAQGRFIVALIDHSNLISHFSIGGWIASLCAFGTASIKSASALLTPAAPADSPPSWP